MFPYYSHCSHLLTINIIWTVLDCSCLYFDKWQTVFSPSKQCKTLNSYFREGGEKKTRLRETNRKWVPSLWNSIYKQTKSDGPYARGWPHRDPINTHILITFRKHLFGLCLALCMVKFISYLYSCQL